MLSTTTTTTQGEASTTTTAATATTATSAVATMMVPSQVMIQRHASSSASTTTTTNRSSNRGMDSSNNNNQKKKKKNAPATTTTVATAKKEQQQTNDDDTRLLQRKPAKEDNKKAQQNEEEKEEEDGGIPTSTTIAKSRNRNQRRRRRGGPNPQKHTSAQQQQQKKKTENDTQNEKEEEEEEADPTNATATFREGDKNNERPSNQKKKKQHEQQKKTKTKQNQPRPSRRQQARREYNQKKNKFPSSGWRVHLPAEAVDPITLEPLDTLRYPPFALAAVEPYTPIPVWPIIMTEAAAAADSASSLINDEQSERKTTKTTTITTKNRVETPEERQRRILAEQWAGTKHSSSVMGSSEDEETKSEKPNATATSTPLPPPPQPKQHLNLYDGRALAYYMVSQLQFIDPLNRRDLTRDEIVNLDEYLQRHGFGDFLNVTEAYDAKGVSISTASAVGNTATGRAAMLQQEASVLLQALFGGGHGSGSGRGSGVSSAANATENSATASSNNINNRLMNQYLAHEEAGVARQQSHRRQRQQHRHEQQQQHDVGVYGDGGFLIIDDDLNPGLRGDAAEFVPGSFSNNAASATTDRVQTLWSASHIASRYGHATRIQEHEFPALGETTASAAAAATTTASTTETTTDSAATDQEQQNKKQRPPPPPPPPTSKTLSKIGSLVKKTDPEELQRQFEAREEARRRAMMSNLTFQSNPAALMRMNATGGTTEIPSTIVTATSSGPTEGQLERNRAFAEALEIKPATVRQPQLREGWARPTEGRLELDEFGNELNTTVYPDSLILQAKERMPLLLKLEKKWKSFLADDSAASLPLSKMDRPSRTFVHAYSDYWKLHTESFDPEPRRYVHCVKLRDTSAPYPLLSDAVRNWRGPKPLLLSTRPSLEDHPSRQTAGQSTSGNSSRSLPPAPDRTPLILKPPAAALSSQSSERTDIDSRAGGIPLSGAPSRSSTQEGLSGRFASLLSERERPKLELQKRTLPVGLPPVNSLSSSKGFDVADALEERKRSATEKERRGREQELAKQRILEAAFASDDEHSVRAARSDSSSEWGDEPEALYAGNDEEEQ